MTPLERLAIGAALTSGWPTITVRAPDEAALLAARTLIEGVLGPLPQADEWEPFADEPWELVVDLPGIEAGRLLVVLAALRDANVEVQCGPGLGPAERWAQDRHARSAQSLGTGDVQATLVAHPIDGGDGRMDLRHTPPDPALDDLGAELALALQARGVRGGFASDRGPDTVQPVIHRATGRFGVRLTFIEAPANREAAVHAVADVVMARADHEQVRLAPDLRWDQAEGFSITAWLVAAPAAALPGDVAVSTRADHVEPMITGLGGAAVTLEAHVVPAKPEQADEVAQSIAADLPPPCGIGAAPRWIDSPPRFAACWTLDAEADPGEVAAWVAAVGDRADVALVRVVPGAPVGLSDRWRCLHAMWRTFGETSFLRVRDPVRDRDPLVIGRSAAPPTWATPLATEPGVLRVSGVIGDDGALLAELTLAPEAVHAPVLHGVLGALSMARPAQASTLGVWGYRGDRAIVQLSPIRPRGRDSH